MTKSITTATALGIHALAFWTGAWLAGTPAVGLGIWVLCWLAGAAFLCVSPHVRWLRLSPGAAAAVAGYAALLALMFWGANMTLDLLGTAVAAGRRPPALRPALPLHLLLLPGVASVGLAAALAEVLCRPWTKRGSQRA